MWIAWTYLKTTADKIKHIFAEKLVYLLIVLAFVQNFSNNLLCHTGALEFRLVASFKTCAFPAAALCFVITWELSDGFIPPQRQRGGNNVLTNKYTRACMRAHSCIAHIPSPLRTHTVIIFFCITQIISLVFYWGLSQFCATLLRWISNNLVFVISVSTFCF